MLTLQKLKVYLQSHGKTTLQKLSKEFQEPPEQILCLAEHYIAKGQIFCEKKTAYCGTSCNNCIASMLVTLQWGIL